MLAGAVALGLAEKATVPADADDEASRTRAAMAALDTELGAGWVKSVTPAFAPERAVLIDDRWATAREDVARLGSGETDLDAFRRLLVPERFVGLGQAVADHATWWAEQAKASDLADGAERAGGGPRGGGPGPGAEPLPRRIGGRAAAAVHGGVGP